ncbi:hypothetical protein GCM10027435_24000 [Haloparvum alkalitolerans]|uniref:DUF7089 family protein n=1 Tax=Haloparvum alkalitolerans TaxID=1042953 RepID=UPI003CE913C6
MFASRELPADVAAVREAHAPEAPVLDAEADFETVPPAVAEDLGLFVDRLRPASYPADWLPEDAPETLRSYAGPEFTVGMPGGGTVVWTDQTAPETVLVKRRAETTPDDFLAFLLAEAFVEVGADPPTGAVAGAAAMPEGATGIPEHFLPFFGERYADLDAAIRDPEDPAGYGPTDVYQVANALFDAWVGLQTRETFEQWADDPERERLHDAWVDAGERLTDRLEELPGLVARGETDFANATEYACSAVRHGLDLPAPFAALDTTAFRDRGAPYAVKWAEKTFDALSDA